MKTKKLVRMFSCAVGTLLFGATVVQAQAQIAIPRGSLGGVSIFRVDNPSPGEGLVAFDLILRADNPEHKLVTFENVKIEGGLSQVWLPGAFGGPPGRTPFVGSPGWAQLPDEWKAADSHILISGDMVGGGAGGSHGGIGEENDLSNDAGLNESLPLLGGQANAVSGVGDIAMNMPTDAFFLDTTFQGNEVKLAHLVHGIRDAEVWLTIGVLGEGIVNSGDPGGANWGFNGVERLCVVGGICIPEPANGLMAIWGFLALLGCARVKSNFQPFRV